MRRLAACRLLAFPALLACAGASRAAAQDAGRMERARAALPRAAASRLDQILGQASAQGLPTAPLIDKTLEGEAKKAPPERILVVVQELAVNLGRARSLLLSGGGATPDDISAVADALRRGVSERAVRSLHDRHLGAPVALAVETLADLHEVGVPDDQALALLQAWADRHGKTAELRDLPAAVERLIRSGTLPAQAAQTVAAAISGTRREAGDRGKSDLAPGHTGQRDVPPVSPGAGPPPGKDRRPGQQGRPGHG